MPHTRKRAMQGCNSSAVNEVATKSRTRGSNPPFSFSECRLSQIEDQAVSFGLFPPNPQRGKLDFLSIRGLRNVDISEPWNAYKSSFCCLQQKEDKRRKFLIPYSVSGGSGAGGRGGRNHRKKVFVVD